MDNPVPLSETQSAEQERARRMFEQQVLRAGGKLQRADGTVVSPRSRTYATDEGDAGVTRRLIESGDVVDDPQDDRMIIDLDIPEVDEKTIYLRSRDGREIPITIPAPRTEVAFMYGRYQDQIGKLYKRMQSTASDQEANRLDRDLQALRRKQIKLLIPTMPDNLLESFNMRVMIQVTTIAEQMVQEAMSAAVSNPINYVRRVYRLVGKPNGDHDIGLQTWLREQFQWIEEEHAGEEDIGPN